MNAMVHNKIKRKRGKYNSPEGRPLKRLIIQNNVKGSRLFPIRKKVLSCFLVPSCKFQNSVYCYEPSIFQWQGNEITLFTVPGKSSTVKFLFCLVISYSRGGLTDEPKDWRTDKVNQTAGKNIYTQQSLQKMLIEAFVIQNSFEYRIYRSIHSTKWAQTELDGSIAFGSLLS